MLAPSPPTEIKVSQNGFKSVYISWKIGDTLVTGYTVDYKQQGSTEKDIMLMTTQTDVTIHNLKSGAIYSFIIVATSRTLPSIQILADNITIEGKYLIQYLVCYLSHFQEPYLHLFLPLLLGSLSISHALLFCLLV